MASGGRGARTMGRGKKVKKPCEDFEANEKSFGMCRRCNFSLAEHLGGGVEEEESQVQETPSTATDSEAESKPASKPCRNFTWKKAVDGEAWAGVCECGFAKEDHVSDNRGVSMRLSRNISHLATRISKRFSQTKGKVVLAQPDGVACDNFRLNLAGDQYGLCKCGFDKPSHAKADEVRNKITKAKQLEEERKARKARGDPSEPCPSFKLDLENKEGYGYCTCGFRRDQHVDFSTTAEFANVKKTLTAPKDFE